MSNPMQVTVAFADPRGVPVVDLMAALGSRYQATVELGRGQAVNGLPLNTIIVTPKGDQS